jgi:hypothetical protein
MDGGEYMAGFLTVQNLTGESVAYPGRAYLSADAVNAVMPVKTKGKYGVQVFTADGLGDSVLPERYDTLEEAQEATVKFIQGVLSCLDHL